MLYRLFELLAACLGVVIPAFLALPPVIQLGAVFVGSRLYAHRQGFKKAMRLLRDANIEKERDLYRQRTK